MKKSIYPKLFSPLKLGGLKLKNRITMAPLYLGYAGAGGKVSPLLPLASLPLLGAGLSYQTEFEEDLL